MEEFAQHTAQALEAAVEDGHHDEGDDGGDGEAADDDDAEGGPHLAAFGARGGHRYHAEDGGEGGHHDGSQTALSAEGDGFVEFDAALAHEVDVVDQHDAVLDHDAYQQHQAEHTHHVDILAGDEERQHGAGEGEEDGYHDDERLAEALELRGHDDEDKQHDECAHEAHCPGGVLLVLVAAAEGHVDACRHVHLVDFVLYTHGEVAQRGLVGHDGEGEVALAVFALDGGRAPVFGDGGELFELDGLAGGGGDGELFDVGDGVAVFLAQADDDVVFLAVLLEVAGGHAVDAVADVEGHGALVEAVEGEFLLVEFYLQLGAVFVAADAGVAGAADVLLHTASEFLGEGGGLVEVVAVDFDAERVVGAAAHHAALADLVGDQLGVFGEAAAQLFLHLEDGAFAHVLLGAAYVHGDFVVGGAVEEGRHAGVVVGAGVGGDDEEVVAYQAAHILFHAACGLEGFLDAGAALQLGADADLAVVLLFHEVHAHAPHDDGDHGDEEDGQGDEHGGDFVVQAPAQYVGVGGLDEVEEAADGLVEGEAALGFFALGFLAGFAGEEEGLFLKHLAGQHGDERDGSAGGDAHHDGDNPAKFLEHDAHHARHHGEWHEDGHEHQGGGDDGGPHLVGGIDGGFAGRLAAFDVLGDVLEHHDGVVDHHADGHGKGGQRDDVERGVGQQEVDEGGDERDGDGEGDDEGGAPVAEEEEHDEHHEEQRVEDAAGEAVDGVDDFLGAVADEGHLDVGRQGFLDLLHLLLHLGGDGHGVGAGLLGDDESCAVHAVDFLVEREVFDGVAHGGQVADEDLFAGGGGGDDNVVDFGAFDVFALDAHLVLLFAHFDGAAGQVEVVGADGVADEFEGYAVGVELLGVEVDVDVALGCAADGDVADAVHAVEHVGDVVLEDAVKTRVALLGGEAELQDGHGGGVELENHGAADAVGQVVVEQVDVGAYVVERLVNILAPFELEGDHRHVVLGGGGDVLEAVHRVQRVLDDLGDVGLDFAGVGTGVGGHHGDVGRVHLGHLVDGQTREGEEAQHDDGHEDEACGDGLVDSGFVDCHYSTISRVVPSTKRACPVTTSWSPALRVPVSTGIISMRSSKRCPRVTATRRAVVPSATKT